MNGIGGVTSEVHDMNRAGCPVDVREQNNCTAPSSGMLIRENDFSERIRVDVCEGSVSE